MGQGAARRGRRGGADAVAGARPVDVAVLFIQGIYTYLRLRLGASTATPSPRLGCHALAAAPAARSSSAGALRRRGRVGERGTGSVLQAAQL